MAEEKQSKLNKIVPELKKEVAAQPKASSTSNEERQQKPSMSKTTRRKSDIEVFEEDFSRYLQSIILLRDKYANRLYSLLVFEVVVMFVFVVLYGIRVIHLEEWFVAIISQTILVKTFLTIQIIVKNLFPNRNLLEMLIQGNQKSELDSTDKSS
jgi:hypothetical protein